MKAIILSFVWIFCAAAAWAAERPNVIVVLVDDARVDDMTSMPVARSIGDEGATFDNAISPFPLCCPARATLLTGQYAHNHGVQSNKEPTGGFLLFKDNQTLATWLNSDYITAWTGKYFNRYGVNNTATYIPPGWNEWFVPDGSVWDYTATRWNKNGVLKRYLGQYQTDTEASFIVDFINRNAHASEPFFLVASFLAPHSGSPFEADDPNVVHSTSLYPTPYVAPRHQNAFAGMQLDKNPAFNEDTADKPVRPAPLQPWEVGALTEVNQQRRESLLAIEEALQQILDTLEGNGILDNTYILFTSDNGFALGEYRIRSGKIMPYDIAVNVPFYLRGPGIPAGVHLPQYIGLHDIAPTVLAMAQKEGAQGDFVLDGVSLLPLISDPRYLGGRAIVIEGAPANGELTPDWLFRGIVTPLWKYVSRSSTVSELYDRMNDPWELQNQAKNPAYSFRLQQMKLRSDKLQSCAGASCLE